MPTAATRRVPFAALDPEPYALPGDFTSRTLSPALCVYLERVRANLQRVLGYLGGRPERWRPHVKTAKIPAVFAEVARAGVRHFKCATTREARELCLALEQRAADVLVAYPLVGPALERLARLAREHPRVRLSVLAEDLAAEIPPELSVFVDVDAGMQRTGVPLGERATILAVARAAGPRFRGVHFYDGHLHGDYADRRERAFLGYARLLELCDWLARNGCPVEEIVTSGTPAFRAALEYAPFQTASSPVHRVSPGTVVYHDLRTEEECPELELVPAALVLARVVSYPGPGLVTCDAGSKSLAAEAGDPCAYVLGHPDLVAQTPSEEHLPLRQRRADDATRPPRGSVLLLVPRHVCPTVNLAEDAVLIDEGRVQGVVAVSARAHDL
jgi:D-serine deaminase-like pyridoxal phosphate-dependent protein